MRTVALLIAFFGLLVCGAIARFNAHGLAALAWLGGAILCFLAIGLLIRRPGRRRRRTLRLDR